MILRANLSKCTMDRARERETSVLYEMLLYCILWKMHSNQWYNFKCQFEVRKVPFSKILKQMYKSANYITKNCLKYVYTLSLWPMRAWPWRGCRSSCKTALESVSTKAYSLCISATLNNWLIVEILTWRELLPTLLPLMLVNVVVIIVVVILISPKFFLE